MADMCTWWSRVLGAGNKNLNKIVEIFVKVLAHGSELADSETADQMLALLNQMQGSLPPQVLLLSWCGCGAHVLCSIDPQPLLSVPYSRNFLLIHSNHVNLVKLCLIDLCISHQQPVAVTLSSSWILSTCPVADILYVQYHIDMLYRFI